MGPKQSLILIFIMQKKCIRKSLKKTPGINYSVANCKIFLANKPFYRCSIFKLIEEDIG